MDQSAFPSHGTMGEVVELGMTMRQYYKAHAPETPWSHYKPVMGKPEPEIPFSPGDDADAWKAWHTEYNIQYSVQWPGFYADAMLAEDAAHAEAQP